MYELLILGLLVSGDMTGYKMKQVLEDALAPRRPISNAVMYPLLKKLEQQGYLAVDAHPENPRHTKTCHLTPEGLAQFQKLMQAPVAQDGQRESIYRFKFRTMGAVDQAVQAQILKDYDAVITTDLNVYQTIYQHLQQLQKQPGADKAALAWSLRAVELDIAISKTKKDWLKQQQHHFLNTGGKNET